MFESVFLKKSRAVGILATSLLFLTLMHGVFCETASAQRLLERLRARIQAPQAAPIPRLQAAPRSPYRPEPFQGSGNPDEAPRVLATPMPGQGPMPRQPAAAQDEDDGAAGSQASAAGSFGIEVTPIHSGQYRGLQVHGFSPNSNAPAAGLRPGDVIVSIDGVPTESLDAVAGVLRQLGAGQRALVHVLRNGRLYQTQLSPIAGPLTREQRDVAQIAPSPPDAVAAPESATSMARSSAKPPVENQRPSPALAHPRASLGIEARDATPERGVLVVTAREGAAGTIAGLKPGDRIVSAEGRLVRDTNSLVREIALLQPGDRVILGIVRGESMKEMEVEMGGLDGAPIRSPGEKPKSTDEKSVLQSENSAKEEPHSSALLPEKKKPAESGQNMLNGVGAVLGDFFSGKTSPPAQSSPAPPSLATDPPTREKTAAAATSSPDEEPSQGDPLALPEDTAVENELPAP